MKMLALGVLAVVLVACGGSSHHESQREQNCNHQLDAIEQSFGKKYTDAERKQNLADCMAHPKTWFTRADVKN